MIDNIVGIASLPIGIILFLNEYGYAKIGTIFGIDILLVAAIVLALIQISNIMGAHIIGENVFLSYLIHFLVIFPSLIFFLSYIINFPSKIIDSLPIVFASVITIEGLYSFFF